MARIDDSYELFGEDCGTGTRGKFTCGICKKEHPERSEDETPLYTTEFAGIAVADCCFEILEKEVLIRMPFILTWFSKNVELKEKLNTQNRALIERVKIALKN